MSVHFDKIGKTLTLSQEIEIQIEDVIRKKHYKARDKLPTEKEMCEMFGVSRTSLREALSMLSARGLINVRKGSGIYVNDFKAQDVAKQMKLYLEMNLDREYFFHLSNVRKIIEPEIAKLAAINRTSDDLLLLQENLEAFDKCRKNDYSKQGYLDRQFHLIVSEASGNKVFPLLVEPIFQLMPKIWTLVYSQIENAKDSAYDYHLKIYNALESKDSERAYNLFYRHLDIAMQYSEEIKHNIL